MLPSTAASRQDRSASDGPRTELNFRRVKPKTFGAYLLSFVAAFRRLQPKTQLVLVASGALILVAGIIGIKWHTAAPPFAMSEPLDPRQGSA